MRNRYKLPKLVMEQKKPSKKSGKNYVEAWVLVEPETLLFMHRFLRGNGSNFSRWVRGQMAQFKEQFREYFDGELKGLIDE